MSGRDIHGLWHLPINYGFQDILFSSFILCIVNRWYIWRKNSKKQRRMHRTANMQMVSLAGGKVGR